MFPIKPNEDIFTVIEKGNFIRPPDDKFIEDMVPWQHAMRKILWGVALTAITIELDILAVLLPFMGAVQLYLGFRSLRRENRWFKVGYWLSLVQMTWALVRMALDLTVWNADFAPMVVLRYAVEIMLLELLLCIRQGILTVQKKAECKQEAWHITMAMAWYVMMRVIPLVGKQDILVGLSILFAVLLGFSLYKTLRNIGDADYAIVPATVKLSDAAVYFIAFGVAFVCLAVGVLFFQEPSLLERF